MTEQEILDGNSLIKNFMKVDAFEYDMWKVAQFTEGYYHKSYDWLMPVVEKIESLVLEESKFVEVMVFQKMCKITIRSSISEFKNLYGESNSKIEAVYKACVDFIKWFNAVDKTNLNEIQ